MDYKIVEFNELTGKIVVTLNDFAPIEIELPVDENGKVPVGDELATYINGFLPHSYIQRKELISNGIANIDEIKALVSQDSSIQTEENIKAEDINPKQTNAQRLNEAILERDNRLSACDWTQLDDVVALHSQEWVNEWREYRQNLRDITEHIVEVTLTNVEGVSYILWPVPPA